MPKALSAILLVLSAAVLLSGCVASPATGKKHLNFVSESTERKLGKEHTPVLLKQYGGELPSNEVVAYVRDLGQRLAAVSERTDLDWEFHVTNSDVINAFALPGGKVFITRGLLEKMTNEAQLAGVLGHEIGHVTDQHAGHQMTKVMILQIGLAGASIGAGDYGTWVSIVGGIGGQGFLLTFSRKQEHTADELGVRYMTKLGFNPMGQVQVMKILKEASEGKTPPEFLSTHPHPESRIEKLEKRIAEKYPDYDQPGKYTWGQQSFKKNVLVPLSKLPPPPKPEQESE